MMWHLIRTRFQMGVPCLLLLRNVLRDPSSGLEDILTPGLFVKLCRFLHQLAGAVCERFSPFAFLAGLFTCGQFALRHAVSLSYTRKLGYLWSFRN
jgi:hypothetical protein